MSDILIKGVSLDDFKPICPCLNGDYGCCDIPGIKRCYGIGKDGCPLVPVRSHGRLIDADALLLLINDSTILPDILKWIINPLIRGEPTVIEAEEGE